MNLSSNAGGQSAPELPRNPASATFGISRLRRHLPSRPWLGFITLGIGFGSALAYDRWQKRQIVLKWCGRVEHLSRMPLATDDMPREIVVWLSSPPGDGFEPAENVFHEYIKPILFAGAVDYQVRRAYKEGEVCRTVADIIRQLRLIESEKQAKLEHQELPNKSIVQKISACFARTPTAQSKVTPEVEQNLILVGRHTYKEFLRGLHEGFLGPLSAQPESKPTNGSDVGGQNEPVKDEQAGAEGLTSSYIAPAEYNTAECAENNFKPIIIPIPLPWLLGVSRMPWRMHRFLTRRYQAEEACSRTAAVVLELQRNWEPGDEKALESEEMDWKKEHRKRECGIWSEPIVIDDRVARHIGVWDITKLDQD